MSDAGVNMARYEVEDVDTGQVLRRHQTRKQALDRTLYWYAGKRVRICRTHSDRRRVVVMEGAEHPTDDGAE